MLRSELRRGLLSPQFAGALAAAFLLYWFSFSQIDWINMLRYPRASAAYWLEVFYLPASGARAFLPLAAALPYAASISDDLDSRALVQVLPRASLGSFARARFLSCAAAGGLVLALARLVFLLLLVSRLPLSAGEGAAFHPSYLNWIIGHGSVFLFLLAQCAFQFLLGMWTAGLSLCVAVRTARRGVIYTFVALLTMILSHLAGFSVADFASGTAPFFFDPAPAYEAPLIILFSGLALLTISYACFYLALRRRVYP